MFKCLACTMMTWYSNTWTRDKAHILLIFSPTFPLLVLFFFRIILLYIFLLCHYSLLSQPPSYPPPPVFSFFSSLPSSHLPSHFLHNVTLFSMCVYKYRQYIKHNMKYCHMLQIHICCLFYTLSGCTHK